MIAVYQTTNLNKSHDVVNRNYSRKYLFYLKCFIITNKPDV